MRAIHIVPAISEKAAGPSYSVVRLCEILIQQGCEIVLATLDGGSMATPPSFLKVFPSGLGSRRLGRSPRMREWLESEVKHGKVAVIHNHSLWMMPNVYPGWVARKYKLPYIVSPRGTLSRWAMANGSKVKLIFWPLVQKPSLETVTCWHATAESEYRDIRRLGFNQPVAVIPNGVDVPDLPPKRSSKIRTLLFLGRIHQKKGLDLLLPAWREVQARFRDWRLVIVGPDNGGYLKEMQKLAYKLKLERVAFRGPLYGHDKWMAYLNSDLFVLPTYSENFGLTVAEALAASTPAIVTKGAPWDGLLKNQAGWWIEIGIKPLVAALEESLSRPLEELRAMGELGKNWVRKDFSWYRIGQMMEETYRWIIEGGPPLKWLRID